LMLTEAGPKLLEYNARFGDPETQVVLPRLKTDLLEIFNAVIDEKLDEVIIEWYNNSAVCVIMASGGYPQKYQTGFEITGISEAEKERDVVVFHAGTKKDQERVLTSGGRVLGVTALGDSLDTAIKLAYKNVEKIRFKDYHYRKDIGIK
jgi:phosphoribosylamine---glycine ligase